MTTKKITTLVVTFTAIVCALLAFALHYESNSGDVAGMDWSFLLSDDETRRHRSNVAVPDDSAFVGVDAFANSTPGVNLYDALSGSDDDFLDVLFDLDTYLIPGLTDGDNLDGAFVFIAPQQAFGSFPFLGAGPANAVLSLGRQLPSSFAGIGRISSGGAGPTGGDGAGGDAGGGDGGSDGGGDAGAGEEPVEFDLVDGDGELIDSGTVDFEQTNEEAGDEPDSTPPDDADNDGPELIALIVDDDIVDELLGAAGCVDTAADSQAACDEILEELLAQAGCTTEPLAPQGDCGAMQTDMVDDTGGQSPGVESFGIAQATAPEPTSLLLLGAPLILLLAQHRLS